MYLLTYLLLLVGTSQSHRSQNLIPLAARLYMYYSGAYSFACEFRA